MLLCDAAENTQPSGTFGMIQAFCSGRNFCLILILSVLMKISTLQMNFGSFLQVNHVTEGTVFFKSDADGHISRGWAMSQVEGTSDFAHGSWLWMHLSGGLNYQVRRKL